MKKNDSIHFDEIAAHTRDRHVMTSRPGFRTDCAQGNQDGLDDDKITSASTSNWIFLIWCHAPDSNCESKKIETDLISLIHPLPSVVVVVFGAQKG